MKKKILTLCLAVCLVVLTGCSKEGNPVPNKESKEEKNTTTIGIAFDSFIIERWQRDRDVFVSTCLDLGAEVLVQNANGVVSEQISQIDYFIDKGVDAIVVVAVDCGSLKDEVNKAHKAGIPVIAYDRVIMDADEDLYISFDNNEVGELMGEALIDNCSKYCRNRNR